jgi:hypothetical protein
VSGALKINRAAKGFKNTSSFLAGLTQKSFEKKGFAQSKLITNWSEIVGRDLSNQSKPLKISFPKSGLGATLIIEIDGAFGPEIDLQRETIRQKVNRVYGYLAIAKIRFKSSPSLGYDAKIKGRVSEDRMESWKKRQGRSVSKALQRSILNFDSAHNKALKSSLTKLSNSFLQRVARAP